MNHYSGLWYASSIACVGVPASGMRHPCKRRAYNTHASQHYGHSKFHLPSYNMPSTLTRKIGNREFAAIGYGAMGISAF